MIRRGAVPVLLGLCAVLLCGCASYIARRQVSVPAASGISARVITHGSFAHDHPIKLPAAALRGALLSDGNLLESEVSAIAGSLSGELGRLSPRERIQIVRAGVEFHLYVDARNLIIARYDGGVERHRSSQPLPAATRSASPGPTAAPPAPGPPPAAAPKQAVPQKRGAIVAVFDIRDSSGRLKKPALEQFTAYLAVKLTQVAGFRVVPRDQLRARLARQKRGSFKQCYDESCQIELGKAVSANKSLSTQLLRVGSGCTISATLYDLKTETTEKAASARTACSEDGLMTGIEKIARQLRR